jgi:hypothetical protein
MTNPQSAAPGVAVEIEAIRELLDVIHAGRFVPLANSEGLCQSVLDNAESALTTLLAGAAGGDAEQDAKRFRFIRDKLCWNVKQVRADGKPLRGGEKFAANFTGNLSELTAEWDASFNTDYGLHESEDDLTKAIDAAMKEASK